MDPMLTEARRVAWKIEGIGPDPRHHLVIFKRSGGGWLFHRALKPGEVLKLSLFESAQAYQAYAVSSDSQLRHSFCRKYQAVGQAWTFTLHFDLHFCVAKPEDLALKLDDDPLQLLEDEIARVLSSTARHLSWMLMKTESQEFGLHLLDAEGTEGLGEKRKNFDVLRLYAKNLGLDLRHIDVSRSLAEGDIQPDIVKTRENADTQLTVASIQHAVTLELDRMKHERARLAVEGSNALRGLGRLRMVLDKIAKQGVRGLSQAVDGVRSFAAINDALAEIQCLQGSFMALSGGQGPLAMPGSIPISQVSPDGRFLGASPRASDPLERLVMELFQHLRALDHNPADKRQLLSIALHLLAEAAQGQKADGEFLAAVRGELEERLDFLEAALDDEPLEFLKRIMDVDAIQQELA